MEAFEIGRFRRAAQRLFHVNMRITRTSAVLPPIMEFVGGLALVGALFYGSNAIGGGRLTTGEFTSFLAALFCMYTPIKRLSRVNATLQGALAAGSRIFGVLDTHQEVREAPDAQPLPRLEREIEYRDVGFRYADGDGARAAPRVLHRAPGRGGRDRGHERRRQDDAREPAAALLRRDATARS